MKTFDQEVVSKEVRDACDAVKVEMVQAGLALRADLEQVRAQNDALQSTVLQLGMSLDQKLADRMSGVKR